MKKNSTLLVLLLFAASQSAYAQRTITGKVISQEDGQGIAGASVVVKGTSTGIITNDNGNFVLNAPNDATIVVSFMGFKTVEIQAGNQSRLDITLEQDINILGNVVVRENRNLVIPPERAVVTVWGVRDKNTLTTSIATISGDIIRKTGNTNFMAALDGRVAGLDVYTDGTYTIMRELRGVKSWSQGNQPPLFVIDGLPMANARKNRQGQAINYSPITGGVNEPPSNDISNIVAQINPEDIESITVIRGQEGVTRYGSDAVNGVVIINMKKR